MPAFDAAVWGLGHIGLVTTGTMLSRGYRVAGIDSDAARVAHLLAIPSSNAALRSIIGQGISTGTFRPISDPAELAAPSLHFVCVNAATLPDGSQSLRDVRAVLKSLSRGLYASGKHTIVIRTTLLPGTADCLISELERATGLREGIDFDLLVNPSFVRHTEFSNDVLTARRIVIGRGRLDGANPLLKAYGAAPDVVFAMDRRSAELCKYADNALHALKVAFTNECATLALGLSADPFAVMAAVAADAPPTSYLTPGGPYAGACLPKDVKALAALAERVGLALPVTAAIERSNARHRKRWSRAHRTVDRASPVSPAPAVVDG